MTTEPAYLDEHPPARSQFRDPRRDDPSGVIVLHTAESVMDTVGPDTGAENVARFIRGRTDPGSYHDLVDSDTTVDLVRWDCEAFHDATGSNRHSLSVSFACSYLDWPKMGQAKRSAFIRRGAAAAAAQAAWVAAETGIVVPARRITRAQSELRQPGFIYHADRDPARRKDPGDGLFPLTEFLAIFTELTTGPAPGPSPTPSLEDPMLIFSADNQPAFMLSGGKAAGIKNGADLRELVESGITHVVLSDDTYDEWLRVYR